MIFKKLSSLIIRNDRRFEKKMKSSQMLCSSTRQVVDWKNSPKTPSVMNL